MEFKNKVYHSQIFRDCSEHLIDGISDTSVKYIIKITKKWKVNFTN